MQTTWITRGGLARLLEELETLRGSGRREIAERLHRAVSGEANLAESAEYDDALEAQARLEHRIAVLQDRLDSAEPVDPDYSNDVVDFGERVRLREVDTGECLDVELVGALEADPLAGRISNVSPLGSALLGLRRSDLAIVHAPRGTSRFEVLAIEGPAATR